MEVSCAELSCVPQRRGLVWSGGAWYIKSCSVLATHGTETLPVLQGAGSIPWYGLGPSGFGLARLVEPGFVESRSVRLRQDNAWNTAGSYWNRQHPG
jgi:hypothetical protein